MLSVSIVNSVDVYINYLIFNLTFLAGNQARIQCVYIIIYIFLKNIFLINNTKSDRKKPKLKSISMNFRLKT